MPIVQMPDGTQVQFPDDMPKDKIRGLIETKFPDAVKQASQPSFLGTLGGEIAGGAEDVAKGFTGEPTGIMKSRLGPMLGGVGRMLNAPFTAAGEAIERLPAPGLGKPIGEAITDEASKRPPWSPSLERPGEVLSTAAGLAVPGKGRVPIPAAPKPEPFGITTPKGPIPERVAGEAKGRLGEFKEQAKQQVESASERIARSFDPSAQLHGATPGEAIAPAQAGLQDIEQLAAKRTKQAYEDAGKLPGAVDVNALPGIHNRIRNQLSGGPNRVIIDDLNTPQTSRAIGFIDRDIANGIVQDKAQAKSNSKALGAPANWVGLNLSGFERTRQGLNTFYQAAFRSANPEDIRGMNRLIAAYDAEVSRLVKSPAYKGDPRAASAWDFARALHSEHQKTFKSSGRGSVSEIVQKIVSGNKNAPTIPNDVADFAFGSSGVNPKSLNVNVVKEIKKILGTNSEGWAGAQQALFAKIMTPTQGEFKPQNLAARIRQFLHVDGREMAEVVYTPQQRRMLDHFADVLESLEIAKRSEPRGGGPFSAMANKVTAGLAHVVASKFGPPGRLLHRGGKAALAVSRRIGTAESQYEEVNKQLPLLRQQLDQWRADVDKAQKTNSLRDRNQAYITQLNLSSLLRRMGVRDVGGPMQRAEQPEKQDKLGFGGPMQ